jgi:hypothetical protein
LASVFAGVPKTFDRINMIVPFVVILIEPYAVEYKKLDLGAPVAGVG